MGQADTSRMAIRLATEPAFGTNPPTGTKAITGASNASPIVITATAHGYRTGQVILVASVGGNTNANGIWEINVLTANTFELVGSQGNAVYTSGGTAVAAVFTMRQTGEGLKYNINKTRSAEIRNDRQGARQVPTSASAGGPLNFELSYKEFDFLLASALQNLWTVYGHRGLGDVFTGTISSSNTITAAVAPTGGSAFTRLQKGQWITLSGFSNSANNILVQVSRTTAPTTTVIVVEGTPLADGANGAACRISSSRLTNGTIQRPWAMEKEFSDIAQIFPYSGLDVDTLDLNFALDAILSGSIGFVGKAGGTPIGATVLAAPQASNTYEQMNPVTGISKLQRDGVTITESLMSVAIKIANNARDRKALGALGPVSHGFGTLGVSGSLEAYLEDGTRFTKFVNNTAFSTTIAALDSSGNGYVITLPAGRFSDANPNPTQQNQDVMDPGSFECEFDPAATPGSGYDRMIFIDRVGAQV